MKPTREADLVYVMHMLECIDRITDYTADGESAFRASRLIQDAVIRNLQIMAESSQRVSETSRLCAPEIPWKAISGFRNVLVHDYLSLDIDLIWPVVARDLPALRAGLERLRDELRAP
ncbi:DUF86 domain-containing protein [Tepidimonas taiwanensis]|uniref:HepT-like ribonuclease domain-containing protein n=1 Tax=Tepidimonas taiwanensis TaxID=307486 RepID=UPI0007342E8C|nr:DUF86 domain-containing protein [Tepidimonas taiwanensis]